MHGTCMPNVVFESDSRGVWSACATFGMKVEPVSDFEQDLNKRQHISCSGAALCSHLDRTAPS